MRKFKVLVITAVLSLFFLWGCNNKGETQKGTNPANVQTQKKGVAKKGTQTEKKNVSDKKKNLRSGKKEKVRVELYVMSQCPYGVQVLNTFADLVKKMGDHIDLHIDYIGNDLGNGNFKSMHGDAEVKGDILELCAIKHNQDNYKYMDFIKCINKNYRKIPQGWETCASQTGIDINKTKACFEGQEGKDLLAKSFKNAKARGASGSPTMYFANKRYMGGRTVTDFMREICNNLKDKPQVCSTLPKPLEFNIYVLSDKRCKKCEMRVNRLFGQIKGMFPGAKIKKLDYSDPEGKKLYKETGIKYLPAFLFEDKVKGDPGYARLQRWLSPVGKGYLSLRLGSKFDPTAEICDNGKDDTGNGKVDCEDPTCKDSLVCRKEMPKDVKVFIMSGCPFGIKAVDSMKEVLKAFKDDGLKFSIHYIADKTPNGFSSLHGQWEVEEDIRQLCAAKHFPKKYLDYIWCRNKNIRDKNWEKCAKEAKLDINVMKKCSTGEEGKKLLEEDLKIAKALSIGASPTWLANNKYKFSGIAPAAIQQNICRYNKDLKGCKAQLKKDAGKVKGKCGN